MRSDNKETEIKILDIDRTEVIQNLKTLKAKFKGKYNLERVVFDLKGKKDPFASIRVRTDGKTVTMTLKDASNQKEGWKTSTPEWEVVTDDFLRTKDLLYGLLYPKHTKMVLHMRNTREIFEIGKISVTIDKWPKLPYLVEIEGPTENNIEKVYKKLDIQGRRIGNKPISEVYKLYGLNYHVLFKIS